MKQSIYPTRGPSRHGRDIPLADLYLLGTGINARRQVTLETLDVLRRCRVVFQLDGAGSGVRGLRSRTIDLDDLYWTGEDRQHVYRRLARRVLDEGANGPGVALVGYGHPLLFDDLSARLRRSVSRRGGKCVVLPAISALDTICIDLGIDYGEGLQLYDASHLMRDRIRLVPSVHTLILQLYEFDVDETANTIESRPGRFAALESILMKSFPPRHPAVIVYSDDGHGGAVRVRTRVNAIDSVQDRMFPGVSLYIPPVP